MGTKTEKESQKCQKNAAQEQRRARKKRVQREERTVEGASDWGERRMKMTSQRDEGAWYSFLGS